MGFQKDGKDGSERWERWVLTKHFHSRVNVFLKIPKNKYFCFSTIEIFAMFGYNEKALRILENL